MQYVTSVAGDPGTSTDEVVSVRVVEAVELWSHLANVGDTDLVFLAICSPRFRPEAYEDLEQQRS